MWRATWAIAGLSGLAVLCGCSNSPLNATKASEMDDLVERLRKEGKIGDYSYLLLAVGDVTGFVAAGSGEEGEGGVWDDEEIFWLAVDLARRLTGGIPYVTDLDRTCMSSPTPSLCCPSSPPRLATMWLSEVYDMHTKLGVFMDEVGMFDVSLRHFRKAEGLCGGKSGMGLRIGLATRTVEGGAREMKAARETLVEGVREGGSLKGLGEELGDPMRMGDLEWTITPPTMMVGYQGIEDGAVMDMVGEYYVREFGGALIDGWGGGVGKEGEEPAEREGKIRVAFISSFFMNHSVGRLMVGVIERLDRTKFDVGCYTTARGGWSTDDVGKRIWEACGEGGGELRKGFEEDREKVRGGGWDVVVWPELGMDSYTLYLSYSRLSPLSMVYWGHPVNQGNPNVDYFITSDLYEGDNGEGREGEGGVQRIMMEGLTTVFEEPKGGRDTKVGGGEWKEGGVEVLYVCSQTLMKFHPDFDDVIAGILGRVRNSKLVITYNPQQRVWKNVLEARMRGRMFDYEVTRAPPGGGEMGELAFVETMEKGKFYGLLGEADVVLDTFPFGGGVTALETFAHGGVMVTYPSGQSVIRLCYGFYKVMGMEGEGVVAEGVEDYVEKAVRFGVDGEERERVKGIVKERMGRLWGEGEESDAARVVQEWEGMFESVVK